MIHLGASCQKVKTKSFHPFPMLGGAELPPRLNGLECFDTLYAYQFPGPNGCLFPSRRQLMADLWGESKITVPQVLVGSSLDNNDFPPSCHAHGSWNGRLEKKCKIGCNLSYISAVV